MSDAADDMIGGDRRSRPRERDLLWAAFTTTQDLVVGCDAAGVITLANPALRRFAGLALAGPPPKDWNAYGITRASNDPADPGDATLLMRVLGGETLTDLEVSLESATGVRRIMAASGQRVVSSAGTVLGAVVVGRDITDQKGLEARHSFHGLHDPLTRLPNRDLFADYVRIALQRSPRYHGSIAVLAINLDHFSHLSNRLGKEAGERVLAKVGRRLTDTLRPYDGSPGTLGIAARLGGDQFLILCEDIADDMAAETAAVRVHTALRAPMKAGGTTLALTAGIGIALTADPSKDPEALILEAQTAMRVAKRVGSGRHERFAPEMEARVQAQVDNAQALREALERGEFRVVYQPKISLLTDGISGVEALLRWQHPLRGVIPPLDFIPLAEESGLIIPIGCWVMEQVCRDAKRWSAVLPGGLPISVAVNVSPRQFEPRLAETFNTILEQSGIDPARICIEVTESVLMQDAELAVAVLRKLKSLGVRISIDDFGTGFSSLAYLKRFPLDELKIDKSFVDGLGTDPEATAIVAAVMGMAHALDLHVVAEGVETADQVARLRTLGCDEAQGYYFARSMTVDAIDALLTARTAGAIGGHGASPSAVTQRLSSGKVLVVDDASDVRWLARSSLAAAGFEVREAASGEEALALVRQFGPDCVVLDVYLPGIGGLEVCRILREDPINEATTIVMLTVAAEPAEKVQAFSFKADDYMVKPFSPRELVSRVTASMRRRAEMLAATPR
ncbi:MAG: EAL domain-containing protein [Candidatus Dormibacteria bacterium]